jgi:hypothetical protein
MLIFKKAGEPNAYQPNAQFQKMLVSQNFCRWNGFRRKDVAPFYQNISDAICFRFSPIGTTSGGNFKNFNDEP